MDFSEAPLDSLMMDPLVHEMTPEQLTNYIKACNEKRASAAARRKSLTAEAAAMGVKKEKTKKKDSVALAMELLNQLTKG